MNVVENHRRTQKVPSVAMFAAIFAGAVYAAAPTTAAATDFSRYAEPTMTEPAITFAPTTAAKDDRGTDTEADVANDLRLKNNAHPMATAPLPPALLTGSAVLLGHWALRKMYTRRWI